MIKVGETFVRRGSRNQLWQRTYERTFTVTTDDPDDGPATVAAALPVGIGDSYVCRNDSDPGSFCQSIDVECTTDDGKGWTAVARYGPYDANLEPANPVERPIKVSWSFARFERPVIVDLDGVPVLNSAGDPFDPPLTIDDSRPILTIVRNEQGFDPLLAYQFKDAVNADAFWGVGPGIVKVLDISDELTKDPDIGWYHVVTYQFEFNPDGWQAHIADLGYRELNLTNELVPILFKGVPATVPARLNGEGGYLEDPDAETVFLDFNVYRSLPFAPLNLDPSMVPGSPS